MQANINNLIIEISDNLQSYTGGDLSYKDAKEEYNRLTNKYKKILNKKQKTSVKSIDGLFYYNNIDNFSILSGIYRIEKDIYPLAYYGDNDLNPKIMDSIIKNADSIEEDKLLVLSPDGDEDFSHNIYLYPVISHDTQKTIFISVSASRFFSEDKFLFIGKLFKNIFDLFSDEKRIFANNYFSSISAEIESYIKNNIDEKYFIRTRLFVFNTIVKIFNHTGINGLLEISDRIFRILKNNFRHNSKLYALSLRDYIVVEKINRDDQNKAGEQNPDFLYNDINIPYQILKLEIMEKESVFSLWDKILIFENYLQTGDIIK